MASPTRAISRFALNRARIGSRSILLPVLLLPGQQPYVQCRGTSKDNRAIAQLASHEILPALPSIKPSIELQFDAQRCQRAVIDPQRGGAAAAVLSLNREAAKYFIQN